MESLDTLLELTVILTPLINILLPGSQLKTLITGIFGTYIKPVTFSHSHDHRSTNSRGYLTTVRCTLVIRLASYLHKVGRYKPGPEGRHVHSCFRYSLAHFSSVLSSPYLYHQSIASSHDPRTSDCSLLEQTCLFISDLAGVLFARRKGIWGSTSEGVFDPKVEGLVMRWCLSLNGEALFVNRIEDLVESSGERGMDPERFITNFRRVPCKLVMVVLACGIKRKIYLQRKHVKIGTFAKMPENCIALVKGQESGIASE